MISYLKMYIDFWICNYIYFKIYIKILKIFIALKSLKYIYGVNRLMTMQDNKSIAV